MNETQRQLNNVPTILVVEDDPATSQFYVDLLTIMGYRILVSASGQAALEQFPQQPVDVVILDRRLPDMDGLAVARHIRTTFRSITPMLLVTADRSGTFEQELQALERVEYVPKPFNPDMLLERLFAFIGSQSAGYDAIGGP